MINENNRLTIATIFIISIVVGQAYLLYRIFELDAAEKFAEIPSLLGITVILYAMILFVYLRVFIGIGAYRLIEDTHH